MEQKLKIIGIFVPFLLMIASGIYADLLNRAPDVLPGTLPGMRDPNYWISQMNNPDEIIMTPDSIQYMNQSYQNWTHSADPFKDVSEERKPQLTYWYPGIVMTVPDLHRLPLEAVADTVEKRIRDEIDYLRSREYGNPIGVKHRPEDIDAFEREMALDLVKDNITVRDGIAICCSRLSNVPSFFPMEVGLVTEEEILTEEEEKKFKKATVLWEIWNIGILKIAKPVIVLHASRSREYLFVLCEVGYGWVRAENIAFGPREKMEEFANPKDFIVCTGDRVLFYADEKCSYASGWFRMGDCLPLVSKSNPRKIKVPVRKTNGELASEIAWLAEDADVHVGWLPYTRRNIVLTAFKLLDDMYDETGAWFGRQHETTWRDIFACFGFNLPYMDMLFTFYGHDQTVLHPEAGNDKQLRAILEHKPFVTLISCGGHCVLLLGQYNGRPIVLDQDGYGYRDENGTRFQIDRLCIGDLRMPTYFLKRNITFLELK